MSDHGARESELGAFRTVWTVPGRRLARRIVRLTAPFAGEDAGGALARGDLVEAALFRCGGCGSSRPIEAAFVAAHDQEVIETYCARCRAATIAICPDDLHASRAAEQTYGFGCATPGCTQRFHLACRLGAALLRRLDGAGFQQPCASCDRISRVRVPEDLRCELAPHALEVQGLAVEEDEQTPVWERVPAGTRVGRYHVRALLAEGGAGHVYRGRAVDGAPVAIKVLKRSLSDQEQMRERFQQEARLIARLRHPNVVRLLDHGELADRRLYLVMELLDGGSLSERLSDPLPIGRDEAFSVFIQLCRALAAVHAQGIVHRDLKPENLILERGSGRATRATLIDFGVAKVVATSSSMPCFSTAHGLLVGSPRYMAPEQIQSMEVDHRADLYALGLLMYETFTDSWPWPAQTMAVWAQLRAHVEEAPSVDHRLRQRCRPMSDLVMACLHKDPRRRPASADEVRVRLVNAWRCWPLSHVGAPDIQGRCAIDAALTPLVR